ncbi:cadherin-like domain-containing protein [Neptunomonas sp. XY-337]|uniref:cadherin-like domain-containing protein n=1 Tax=Neptunomonas sp. XY-337 TaxID=2561897 RepID=UPI0010A9FCB5|nr:cadherin-like domain-containing protein [Neptunomonas sp. XY-337]
MRNKLVIAMGLVASLNPLAGNAIDVTVNGVTKSVTTVTIQHTASGVQIDTNPAVEFSSGGGSGNNTPTAVADSQTTAENTPVTINLVANDTDSDGSIDPQTVNIVSQPSGGSLGTVSNSGTVQYTPNGGYIGNDSFTYTVRDNEGALSNTATVSIAVGDVSELPVANADNATTDENTPVIINVLSNDTDNGTLTPSSVAIASSPSNGATSINTANGAITYTPNNGFTGSDSFTYTVQDNDSRVSNTATVTVAVNAVSACGALPAGVEIGTPINWGNPGNQQRIGIAGNKTVAMEFTATNNSAYYGFASIASTTGNSGVTREVWISSCPGVGYSDAVSRTCGKNGTSSTKVYWEQSNTKGYACDLVPGETYYLNVKNVNCSGTCDVFRNLYNSGNP